MKKSLTYSEILEIAQKAGLKKNYFSDEKFYYATVYRALMVCLLNFFCNKNFNITNSEYALNEDESIKEFAILVDFYKNSVDEFVAFISDNSGLIPVELRQMFDMFVGYNYGDEGALVIREKEICHISQDEFMANDSEGSWTDGFTGLEVYMFIASFKSDLYKYIQN